MLLYGSGNGSNLTNKYNPQELLTSNPKSLKCSNLTNKYNPQEHYHAQWMRGLSSNLTNKYNPQELDCKRGLI